MTPGSADFRRANRNPSYQCLPRAEYVQRAVEIAPRGSQLAKKLTVDDVKAMRFTIGKYNRRMGKKDDLISEIEKIRDYATRWLEVEQGR